MQHFKQWVKKGEPWVWLNGGAVAISIVMVVGLMGLIAVRGLGHFWPHAIMQAKYENGGSTRMVLGEHANDEWIRKSKLHSMGIETAADVAGKSRVLLKMGNRDITGQDFGWFWADDIKDVSYPENAVVVERAEWGNFYGFVGALKENGNEVSASPAEALLNERLARSRGLMSQVRSIEKGDMSKLNYRLEKLRLSQRRLEIDQKLTPQILADYDAERAEIQVGFDQLQKQITDLKLQADRDTVVLVTLEGVQKEMPLSRLVKITYPNTMGLFAKVVEYGKNFWNFLADDPRESNTEGGIFPAIFGTVLMVIIMSVIVTPFGVIAAVYLREYARQGWLTRAISIAVNNLAGVPSVVYGVFGLGFFVYFLGGAIDKFFYPEAAPSPVFGTPGLMWASITLAILTVPVVIVSTEEGLSRIPRSVREGSLALGATKFETLWRVVLPMASPAMMTGLILAIARAAGEVAPLMLVGVVKLAPALPLDGNAPFLHLDRKFMHLGFHIFDVGFQSPNVEASQPLVYATAFLLVAVIAILNMTAVMIRNRLRERYRALET